MRVLLKYFSLPLTLFAIDLLFGFQVYSNDFFGYLGLVTVLDFDDPSTFYNGVYPPGFVWLLKCILRLSIDVIFLTKILNYFCLGLVVYFLSTKFFKETPFYVVFISFTTLLLTSNIFLSNILSPGSYCFFLVSIIVGTSYYEENSKTSFLICTSSLILATLFRFEAFIWVIGIWVSGVFFVPDHSKNIRAYLPLIISILILLLINFLGTNAFVATKHFLTFEEPKWVDLNPFSKFEKQSFPSFTLGYLNNLINDAFFLVVLTISLMFLKSFRRLTLTCLIYLILINFHSSPRGAFAILPFIYLLLGQLFYSVWLRERRFALVISIFLIPTFLYLSLNNYYQKKQSQAVQNSFHKIGQVLTSIDKNFSIQSVFSNSHDFYLKNQLPGLPKVNGGWIKLVEGFYNRNPNFDLSHSSLFYQAVKSQNVRFLVIDKVLLHPSIYSFKDLNTLEELANSGFFKEINVVDNRFIVYEVKESID